MLHSILHIKITQLSEVIQIFDVDSNSVLGFYIIENIYPLLQNNLFLNGILANSRFSRKLFILIKYLLANHASCSSVALQNLTG